MSPDQTQFAPGFGPEVLTHSQEATRRGIDNSLPEHLVANAKRLSWVLWQIQQALIRRSPNAVLHVSSGYRSPELNAAIGGAMHSAHKEALAADLTCNTMSAFDLANFIWSLPIAVDQLIFEFKAWAHLGLSPLGPRRQLLTAVRENNRIVYETGLIA